MNATPVIIIIIVTIHDYYWMRGIRSTYLVQTLGQIILPDERGKMMDFVLGQLGLQTCKRPEICACASRRFDAVSSKTSARYQGQPRCLGPVESHHWLVPASTSVSPSQVAY